MLSSETLNASRWGWWEEFPSIIPLIKIKEGKHYTRSIDKGNLCQKIEFREAEVNMIKKRQNYDHEETFDVLVKLKVLNV